MKEQNISFIDLSKEYDFEVANELLVEKPVGWSSACLYPTIDYYLNHSCINVEKQDFIEEASEN